jgi:hypothetical protein
MNYKHAQLTFFKRKVITPTHTADFEYLIISGCFADVEAFKRP